MRRRRTYRTRVIVIIISLSASIVAWVHFYRNPLLVVATGYPKLYWLQPLKYITQFHPDSFEAIHDYSTLNWNNDRLFIDGGGLWEYQTWAPPGAFIVAALPHGIGFAWHEMASQDEVMSGPYILPYLFIAPLVALGLFGRTFYLRICASRWRANGCCSSCGYDLTGNTSGVCPECGEKI